MNYKNLYKIIIGEEVIIINVKNNFIIVINEYDL